MDSRWVHETAASGRFLRGGFYHPEHAPVTEAVAVLSEADPHPDPATERYDAGSPRLRRPATQAELDADVVLEKAAAAQREGALKLVRTTVVWTLFKLLGRNPTGPEVQAAMDEWRTAFRALS